VITNLNLNIDIDDISAFGGDYKYIDGIYGHLMLAKQNVAKALSIKIGEGLFGFDEAKRIARMFFYNNPKKIFGLKNINLYLEKVKAK